MPGQSNCYGTSITLLGLGLGLLVLFPTTVMAQQQAPRGETPGGGYSPPMATVLIVLIVVFFLVGLVSIYLRHFAWWLGYETPGGGGGAWRRQEARGLDPAILESFPTFLYSDVKQHRIGKGTLECAVCINEFEDDEVLRLLPGCSHVFHPDCIRPWLSSHVTCPVCRANLEDQHNRQFDSLLQQLNHQPSEEESEPSINQINQEVIVGIGPSPDVIKSPVQEIKAGGARMGKLPRSHSTGHSLIDDCERFTLRLPEEVRNKLVNTTPNFCTLPSMVSPRIGFRARSVGCTGMPIKPDRWRFSVSPPFISRPGSTLSPKSDGGGNITPPTGIMSGPRNLLKSIKSPLNPVSRTSDIGERSSDRLWPSRPSQDLELESQQ